MLTLQQLCHLKCVLLGLVTMVNTTSREAMIQMIHIVTNCPHWLYDHYFPFLVSLGQGQYLEKNS